MQCRFNCQNYMYYTRKLSEVATCSIKYSRFPLIHSQYSNEKSENNQRLSPNIYNKCASSYLLSAQSVRCVDIYFRSSWLCTPSNQPGYLREMYLQTDTLAIRQCGHAQLRVYGQMTCPVTGVKLYTGPKPPRALVHESNHCPRCGILGEGYEIVT